MSADPDLNNFKRTINLADFAGGMGYTIDWRDSWSVIAFTGFASGGIKGLWFSHAWPEDRRLVIEESAIDSLSYQARYASIGGKINPAQPGLIRSAILRMPEGSEIIAAMDADAAGAACCCDRHCDQSQRIVS